MQDERDGADAAEPRAWDEAPDDIDDIDDIDDTGGTDEPPGAEVIFDPAPTSASDGSASDAAFTALLRSLRALPGPCAPPIGEGAFDILYASAREIVVWFVPAKDGREQKEVVIPARLARVAWEMLLRGDPVDEAALRAIAAGAAGGRWLLALFAQLPSVEVRAMSAPDDAASEVVTLQWRGDASA